MTLTLVLDGAHSTFSCPPTLFLLTPRSPTLLSSAGQECEYAANIPDPTLSVPRPLPPNQRARSFSPGNNQLAFRKGHAAKSLSPFGRSSKSPSNPPRSARLQVTQRKTTPSPDTGVNQRRSPLPSISPSELRGLKDVLLLEVKDPWELYVRDYQQTTELEVIQQLVNAHCSRKYQALSSHQLKEGERHGQLALVHSSLCSCHRVSVWCSV